MCPAANLANRSPASRKFRRINRLYILTITIYILAGKTVLRSEVGRAMRTQATKRFGIEFPVFAFSHCRDVVAAVTNAGGMGILGAAWMTPEELEMSIGWIESRVEGKPYGVDLVFPGTQPGSEVSKACTTSQYAVRKILSHSGRVPVSRAASSAQVAQAGMAGPFGWGCSRGGL